MTIRHLMALAARHGYELTVGEDGNPKLKPTRDDATLPGKVKYTFQTHRQIVVDWFRRHNRQEWERCRLCLATVHESMTPTDAELLCHTEGTRTTPNCPYKDPAS